MSINEAQRYLKGQSRKFRLLRLIESALLAFGFWLLAFGLVRLVFPGLVIAVVAGVVIFVVTLVLRIRRTGALKWDPLRVTLYLNNAFPELKESADLLVSEKPATSLEEVQCQRVLSALEGIKPRVSAPHRIGQGLLVLVTGALAMFLLPAAKERPNTEHAMITSDSATVKVSAPTLSAIEVQAAPPLYTGIKSFAVKGGSFKVPAGSRITWQIRFNGSPVNPAIRVSNGDSLALLPAITTGQLATRLPGHQVSASIHATQPAFYQVTWRDSDGKRYLSDFFHADTREDAAPVVAVVDRQQFQVVKPGDPLQLEVKVSASDDYGLRDAHLVATVTKGSGEGVKFREVTLTFDHVSFPRKNAALTRPIDLAQLGLEPGDELYFYAEAIDSRTPSPNLSRTETFFIALQDTAEAITVADSGLGIDLMPDYFRSQRQLIIDTEKLLAEQRRIKKSEFNFKSNELGFDQKALRLKYGQFLGMEDELGIGVTEPVQEEPAEDEENKEEDPSKKFGHEHDKENEHNLVDEKKKTEEAGHEHDEHAEVEGADADPMKAFLHEHDSEEEATFFHQTVKAKLQAALTLMWDSELHLRMYEPKKSLPYQYKILNLLKEISQDNRAYVHRTGFDAPPIKEERRLTGELNEVASSVERIVSTDEKSFLEIREALEQIEYALQQEQPVLSPEARRAIEQAGYEVAAEALKQPGKYFRTLSSLRKLADGTEEPANLRSTLLAVRADFWLILPKETYSPGKAKRTLHPIDRAVLQEMKKSRGE